MFNVPPPGVPGSQEFLREKGGTNEEDERRRGRSDRGRNDVYFQVARSLVTLGSGERSIARFLHTRDLERVSRGGGRDDTQKRQRDSS